MVANYVNKIGVQNIDGTYSYQDIGTDSDHIEVDATGKKLSAKLTELENATPDVATSSTPGIVKPGTGMEVDDTGALNLTYDHTLTLTKEDGTVIDTYDGSADKTISVATIPTDHSSVNTTYGVATTGKYGHVKVVDTYQTEPGATNGTVASATALHEAYKELKAGTGIHKTQAEYNALPESEKKNGSTYYVDDGKDGTLTSDNVAYDNSVSALSAEYVKTAIDELAVRSAKPTAHPSSTAETYGAGTGSEFGHVRLSDSYKASDGNADASVAASSYALYQAYNELNSNLNGIDISSGVTALATFRIDSIDLKLRGNHVSGNIVVSLQSGGVFHDSYILQIPKEYAPKFVTSITANGYLNSATKYLPGYGTIHTDGRVIFYSDDATNINKAYISFSYDI